MNLRCSFCQTPFTLGRIEKLDALQHMDANNLTHYDAQCPRCRRATPVLRQRLEMTMPNWRESLKELEAEMKANPQQAAPPSKLEAESAAMEESKPAQHRTRAGRANHAPAKDKPANEKPAKEKPAKQKKATQTKASAKKGK
jgi:hypothetical protein